MFDKETITEITDWDHIDYICLKSKPDGFHMNIYYLDGHPVFEASLTSADMDFIDFARSINSYGTSEKIFGDSSSEPDRFYIRVNISNEQQELKLIDYLTKGKGISSEQNQVLNYLRHMDFAIKGCDDYRPLYYCGFVKKGKSASYDSIRFYFKSFGADESIRRDIACIDYCEQCPIIKKDAAFQVVRDLVLTKRAGLKCVGVDFTHSCSVKIKYYLCEIPEAGNITELLLTIKKYPQYTGNANAFLRIMPDIQSFRRGLLQISSGYFNGDEGINIYLERQKIYPKKYYAVKDGLVLRDIGGILFLIDIHEKHYYDLKQLFSVNETGQIILKYMMENGVCNLDGIVSYLRSLIKNYDAKQYPVIYSDCKKFVESLQTNGYLQEVM